MSIGRGSIANEPIAAASVEMATRKPPKRRVIIVYGDAVLTPEPR